MHGFGGELGAAQDLDQHVGFAGERFVVALREDHVFATAVSVADELGVDLEQLRLGEQQVEHALADRAAAEQRDAEPLGPGRPRLRGGKVGDGGRFGRAERSDFDQHVLLGSRVDRLDLDEAAAGLLRFRVAQLRIALCVWVACRVLVVNAVHVLDQAHPMRVEPVGEEDGAEVSAATTERHDAMIGVICNEAGQHHDIVLVDLQPDGFGVDAGQIGIERRAFRVQRHFLRIERPCPKPGLAKCQCHQRRRL